MHDALTGLLTRADRWLDATLAAAVVAVGAGELVFARPLGAALTIELAAVETFGALAVALRRRWPLTWALAFSAASFFPGVAIGSRWIDAPSDAMAITQIVLAYTVGADVDGLASAVGLVALCVGSGGGDLSDPIVLFVFTVPAWVAGNAMRSRARLAEQLTQRALELEHEREAYAREAIRYERARIARDLHDVVAHNLSVVVVQAAAGRRALSGDPAVAAESLRHIQEGAAQAEREIAQLADLLADPQPLSDDAGLAPIDELVKRAASAGLAVSYAFTGTDGAGGPEVRPTVARAAFHVVQEGITNALKHAPGAPIRVTVHRSSGALVVTVDNQRAQHNPTGLESAGGSYGIAGLRDRVDALGGCLEGGPTPDGGWRLAAEFPSA